MPLPDAVGTVTIAYDIRHPASGNPATGTIEVTIPYALRDSTDNVIITPGVIVGTVTAGTGEVVIPDPNDPDISPQGWAPHIKVLTDAWAAEFDVLIPEGSEGTTVQLADLAPAESPPVLVVYALAGHTHSGGGGGGDVPDATTTTKGILRLAGDLGGTATTPTVPGLAAKYVKPGSGIPSSDLTAAAQASLALADTSVQPARQIITGTGLTGGGTLAADRTLALTSAVQTSLGKADTAVQPGQLATVATSGAYADLTGKPSIPDSYDDLTGTVPTSALPTLAITEVFTVASQAAMLALTAQRGDVAIRTDISATFILASDSPGTLADWKQLAIPADAVLSVNGQTGIVVLSKGDVGLGNVSNLAPADLPVSTATQTALDGKQTADADLTTIAGLAPSDNDLLQRISGAWAARTPAQVKTSLNLVKGDVGLGNVDNTADTDKPVSTAQQTALDGKQNVDADLTAIAALAASNDDIIQRKSGAWTNRTIDQLVTDLALAIADVAGLQAALDAKAALASPTFTGTVTAPRVITPPVTLTDAATIATDASLGNHFRVVLGGNRTLGNPTNSTDGQKALWELIQDGTGSRVITLGSDFALGTDISSVVLTTAINKRDFLGAVYNSTAAKWFVIAFAKGY